MTKLTNMDGDPLWVNTIVAMWIDGKHTCLQIVGDVSNVPFWVRETPEQILTLIETPKKDCVGGRHE